MKPEAQRIAIAKACGYLNPRELNPGIFVASCGLGSQGEHWGTRGIPDYLYDLNDINDAVLSYLNTASSQMNWDYAGHLGEITLSRGHVTTALIHATAAQRAKAFLKTLNLWTDDN